jgi:hypothetical protein
MSWRDRILQMTMAGGLLSAASCNGICGNANPDPCICGRPDESAEAKAMCDAEKACESAGGSYDPDMSVSIDGSVVSAPHCEKDGGTIDAGKK